jgi:isoquinoline 1-oxidoreductase beta subunit
MTSEATFSRGRQIARRTILVAAGVIGGGLLIGAGATAARLAMIDRYRLPAGDGEVSFGAWLKIMPDGTVEVAVPHQEMGQGIYSLATLMAAEGLLLPVDAVRAVQAPSNVAFANPTMFLDGLPFNEHSHGSIKDGAVWTLDKLLQAYGLSATGGSSSTRNIAAPIHACAATALDMLTRAGAERFGVAPDLLKISGGRISEPGGKSVTYSDLAAAAAKLRARTIQVPPLAGGTYVGKGIARADVSPKTNGTAPYGIDVREKGQLYAAIRHSPRIGGKLKDAQLGQHALDVHGLVKGEDYVAVVATSYCKAVAALEQVEADWDDSHALKISTKDVFAAYRAALDNPAGQTRFVFEATGDGGPSSGQFAKTYQVPFLAHVTMEPMNATALVTDQRTTIWAGHQSADLLKYRVAHAVGASSDAVDVVTPFLGGGFGRRADLDYAVKAAEIALQFKGTPVQTIWSRAEDIRDDYYRPAAMVDVSATLDDDGMPSGLRYRIATPSVTKQILARIFPSVSTGWLCDRSTVDGAVFSFYGIKNRTIENVHVDLGVPVGFWRSVGYSINNFFFETFIDELAAAASIKPIEYRARLLSHGRDGEAATRARNILARLAKLNEEHPIAKADYGGKTGRGVALSECFHSFVGQMADVEVVAEQIRVKRVFAVVDCGFSIDPPNVIAQVRSAINFGLSAALFGMIEIENGKIVQENFDTYRVLTLDDAPEITVEIADSGADIGGVGEIGTPGIAPAVGNAIFAATGMRLRSLPLTLNEAKRA